MQAWTLDTPRPDPAQSALGTVIGAVARPHFAAAALAGLQEAVGAASWAVYRLRPDRAPTLHLSASRGVPDTTGDCFATYRDAGLYRRDRSFDAVRTQGRDRAVMLRMHADEAPSADHRQAIYLRHGMVERLSVARLDTDGSLLAVNLYRHAPQGGFEAVQLEHFGRMAPALLAAVARHAEWQDEHAAAPAAAETPRQALRRRCAALTGRELDVLERLLRGMTYDGIAADLGLSLATVKTYRARAFERLELRFKSELFAAFLPRSA
ncbi:helix-turn-helix domain-containing protein [Azohydromonas caseinilytica]|uniref:Helix-turn-helix transcriptional regulator n=1 Tax=Azohydromonas caseinilytica TaxID=2728836 RepID=A0A848FBU7_9BURK|nr:helix-turn-helix transcriptional regulator [Azohydromonas caseinilytica]NML16386.1 helix-turn-helix transcriptional regulator [Azohydromonas caseinilytica]